MARSTRRNPARQRASAALFLFHSLLSDRASFDAIVPKLARSHRVIVPELPGFGASSAVDGGLAAVADRMAEAVKEAAAGDETHRARQRLWRVRGVADGDPPSRHRQPVHSRRLRRGVFGKRARSLSQHGGGVAGPRGWLRSPTSRCAGCSRRSFRRSIPI